MVGKHNIFLAAERKHSIKIAAKKIIFPEKPKRQPKLQGVTKEKKEKGEKKCSAVSINEPYKLGFLLPLFCFCAFTPSKRY